MFDHIRADLAIIRERDPAARGWLEIVCCYPGFQALSLHRLSHRLWTCRLPLVEQSLRQNRSQLMRMPQVHCAESYLSTDTIELLRKEIGLQSPAAAS